MIQERTVIELQSLKAILAGPVGTGEQARRAALAAELLAEYFVWAERVRDLVEPGENGVPAPEGIDLAGLSLHEAARRVLADAGRPLHARELGRRIKARGWRHPRSTAARPEQIVFQLAARLPHYPGLFRRVAPNTFALTEWDGTGAARERPRPRVGIFRGPGEAISEMIGESDEPFAQGRPWRSS